MITVVLNFFKDYINLIICSFGIGILMWMFIMYGKLSSHKKSLEELLDSKTVESRMNQETEKQEIVEISKEVRPEDVYKKESQYRSTLAWNNIILQLIPVFPLLGILGTVAALMTMMGGEDAAATMMDSLGVALSSTLLGLIASIILKIMISFLNLKCIDDIESKFKVYYEGLKKDLALTK